MKKILAGVVTVGLLAGFGSVNAQFSDVQKDSLNYLYKHGLVNGYSDGTFKPGNSVNRAELLKMVMDAGKIKPGVGSNCFSDVKSSDWFAGYVCEARKNGWVAGYDNGEFRPGSLVNKAEAIKIMVNVLGWRVDLADNPKSVFLDVKKTDWFFGFVNGSQYLGMVDKASKFFPANNMTRGEVAELVFRFVLSQKMGFQILKNLAVLARDFFKIERIAEMQKIDQIEPTNIVKGKDGYRYVMSGLSAGNNEGYLELELAPYLMEPYGHQILFLGKYDSSGKLIADWWQIYFKTSGRVAYEMKLLEANDGLVKVEFDTQDGSGISLGKAEKSFVLDQLR